MSFFNVVGFLTVGSSIACCVSSMRSSSSTTTTVTPSAGLHRKTLIIGDEGVRYGEESKTETYMSSMIPVPDDVHEYGVYVYNPDDSIISESRSTPGPETWDYENKTCPDGTYDCLYYERAENGRITKITNDEGEDLIKIFVDDLYAGKLPHFEARKKKMKETHRFDEQGRMFKTGIISNETGEEYEREMKPREGFESKFVVSTVVVRWALGAPKPTIILDLPAKTRDELQSSNLELEPGIPIPEDEPTKKFVSKKTEKYMIAPFGTFDTVFK